MSYEPHTKWWLIGREGGTVHGAYVSPWQWKFTRGASPYIAAIAVPDDRFEKMRNPVELRVETPRPSMGSATTLRIRNLYLIASEALEVEGWRRYLLTDVRWMLAFGKITASYNIVSYGGELRPGTDRNGRRWTRREALEDAFARCVASVEQRHPQPLFTSGSPLRFRAPATRTEFDTDLPDNLGNTPQGGYVGATWAQVSRDIIGDLGDVAPNPGGWLEVVDRETRNLTAPENWAKISGILDAQNVVWQRPQWVVCHVPRRHGGILSTAAPGVSRVRNLLDPEIANVAPAQQDDPAQLLLNQPPDTPTWQEIETNAWLATFQKLTGVSLGHRDIEGRFFQPSLIDNRALSAPQRVAAAVLESILRRHWRLTWQIRDDDIRREYAHIELGRLRPDGTVEAAPAEAPYTVLLRYQREPDAPLSNQTALGQTAFSPQWIDREGLVFRLVADGGHGVDTVYPGELFEPIRIPDLQEIVFDNQEITTEAMAAFRSGFEISVHWAGDWVGDERADEHEFAAFTDGEIGAVHVLVTGITANYRQDEPGGNYEPINEGEVMARCRAIAEEVKATYRQPRNGTVETQGVAIVSEGLARVRGEVNEIAILFGAGEKLHTITTQIDVTPQRRPRDVDPAPPQESRRML